MKKRNIYMLTLLAGFCMPAAAQQDSTFTSQTIDVGAEKTFSREQSTASATVITNKNVDILQFKGCFILELSEILKCYAIHISSLL